MDPEDRSSENDWFRKNERELLEQARRAREERERERQASESAAQRKELRDRHWMKCPKCGHDLKTENLVGVEIDRCTHCEGVFLDPGEIETVIRKKEDDRRGFIRGLLGI